LYLFFPEAVEMTAIRTINKKYFIKLDLGI